MCTIMTFSREKFLANKDAIITRIKQDFNSNSHGSSLILQGATTTDTFLGRALNVEYLIATLTSSDNWQRFWLHNRFATTQFRGLTGAHGFHARHSEKDYYVMHNGSFRHQEANQFNVDSEWLAMLTRKYGPEAALHVVNKNESFANCFLICPTEGEWYMSRASNGSLHTDGEGNFSTNQVIDLKTDVPDRSLLKFTMTVTRPTYGSTTTYGWRNEYRGTSTNHSRTGNPGVSSSPTTGSASLALGPSQLTEGKWVKQGNLYKKKAGDVIFVTRIPKEGQTA